MRKQWIAGPFFSPVKRDWVQGYLLASACEAYLWLAAH